MSEIILFLYKFHPLVIMGRMNDADIEETRSASVGDETMPMPADTETAPQRIADNLNTEAAGESAAVPPAGPPDRATGQAPGWRWLILLSLIALVAIATASVIGGYRSGINQRTRYESTQVAQK